MQQGLAQLSEWEITQARNARHRALILQILNYFPKGLTTQQIIAKSRKHTATPSY
jgi:hypothetical protein